MAIFKSDKPNYKVSAMEKLIRFWSNGTVTTNKPEVIKFLESLPNVSRVDVPKKAPVKKANEEKPKKASKKKAKKKDIE